MSIRESAMPRRPTWEAACFSAPLTAAVVIARAVSGGAGASSTPAEEQYVVYLIGGGFLTEFDRLACARRFREAIDGLTDWAFFDARDVAWKHVETLIIDGYLVRGHRTRAGQVRLP
jgi:hypothetical protein